MPCNYNSFPAELTVIDLNGLYQSELPVRLFNKNKKLRKIDIDWTNQLKTIPKQIFQHNKMITEIDLQWHAMKNPPAPETFQNLKKLKVLQLESTYGVAPWKNMTVDYFQNMPNLEVLSIKVENPPCKLFNPLKNLKRLYMDYSNLSNISLCKNIFGELVKLEVLSLVSCELTLLPTMSRMVNLKKLYLGFNHDLKSLAPVTLLNNLEWLGISNEVTIPCDCGLAEWLINQDSIVGYAHEKDLHGKCTELTK